MRVDSRQQIADGAVERAVGPSRMLGIVGIGIALALIGAVAVRFWDHSNLWLDEALSVNIARLPLDRLPDALRHDGAPPLYYALLHVWMTVFGETTAAVRALSVVTGLVTLVVAYFVGRRIAVGVDRRSRVAWALVLLTASSPFAIRYSTEVRMYALVILLVFLGALVVLRAFEQPSVGRLAAVAAVTAALLYTHYWSFFLLATVAVYLVWRATVGSPEGRGPARRVGLAVVVGGLAFVPWLPVLRYQSRHTGTPWANATLSPSHVAATLSQFAGGRSILGRVLLAVVAVLLVVAVVRWWRSGAASGRRTPVGWIFFVGAVTLGVGLVGSYAQGTTYQVRYAAVVLPFVLMAAALGAVALTDRRAVVTVLGASVVLGLLAGYHVIDLPRTQAGAAASVIVQGARPGDVVAFCPDQLGPSVTRLDSGVRGLQQVTFPRLHAPERVDWVDYADRIEQADPGQFADRVVRRAGAGAVWYVWSPGYQPFGTDCERVIDALSARKGAGQVLVAPYAPTFERMGVVRFGR